MNEPRASDLVTSKIRLVKALGAGGMGSVWLADHLALHIQVVVKFIAEELARNKEAIARFEREAAAAAQVKSPHVVQILDHGVSDAGMPFIVMELLEGRDLGTHIEKYGRVPVEDVAEIVAQSRGRSRARTSAASSIATSSRTTSSCATWAAARSS
jgi:serine/threonine-protein kinase